ncbi:MAG TPA: response regulator [Gemmatimonadaceae bacterium]|nr:response regulator [Gemmatimonadaceae bacterium]
MRNRILVVDDYMAAARALAGFLTAVGYEVAVAFDAGGAVELAPTFRPHLVIVDLNLAGTDGCAVAQRLRADGALADAGLLAMSGSDRRDTRQRAFAAGFDGFFLKPFDLDRLVHAVKSLGVTSAHEHDEESQPVAV